MLTYVPDLTSEHWQITVNRADERALRLYERHYSAYVYKDGRKRTQYISPGEYIALMTADLDALFVWQKSKYRRDGEIGVNCAVFRNESSILSSDLIQEAVVIAWRRWQGERLFTYVNPAKIRSTNPGYCFKKAGWKYVRTNDNGLLLFELQSAGMVGRNGCK